MLGSLLENLKGIQRRKSRENQRKSEMMSDKTAADYIKENEIRLRSCGKLTEAEHAMSNDEITNSHVLLDQDMDALKYKFEKVKTVKLYEIQQYEEGDINDVSIVEMPLRSSSAELEFPVSKLHLGVDFRPRTTSMPTKNTLTKPILRNKNSPWFKKDGNLDQCEDSYHFEKSLTSETYGETGDKYFNQKDKFFENNLEPERGCYSAISNELALDDFLQSEMRARASSMPTKTTYRKPHTYKTRLSHQHLNIEPKAEPLNTRAFELTKGKLIKRDDSRSTRSTNSIYSSEGESCSVSINLSRASSISIEENIRQIGSPKRPTPFKVYVQGLQDVGKTSLTQQFMTSDDIAEFDTSIGKSIKSH